jgi:phosphopantothenoylcysteine decarboxylase/phosphopantothenate--cysteine ligase
MPSLTVRQLDEKLKKQLRLRAARNGRSVEDEVRTILRSAAADSEAFAAREAGERTSEAAHRDTGEHPRDTARYSSDTTHAPDRPRILLIIGGGIAAYKSLDLIRRFAERGCAVRVVMTTAAQKFITPLSVGALAGERAFTELFDPQSEFDVGHIRLARDCALVVVAPATADLMAKIAGGHADDLASAVLLATNRKILLAPAMNPAMWGHAATRRNLSTLIADGIATVGPNAGEMAEKNEAGVGRMAEPMEIVAAAEALLAGARGAPAARPGALSGLRVLVTSGPTHEPIDPVRYIANRSSGKQGHAIAAAAAAAGAEVVLVSGPVNVADPPGVDVVRVETARDMLSAVEARLPADVAIFVAAVADWRVEHAGAQKLKKSGRGAPQLSLTENPDILATVAKSKAKRPRLVIGFAAETENIVEHAKQKLARKGCDWILANDVSAESGVMGGDVNTIQLVTRDGVETWPPLSKEAVAARLAQRIAAALVARATVGATR